MLLTATHLAAPQAPLLPRSEPTPRRPDLQSVRLHSSATNKVVVSSATLNHRVALLEVSSGPQTMVLPHSVAPRVLPLAPIILHQAYLVAVKIRLKTNHPDSSVIVVRRRELPLALGLATIITQPPHQPQIFLEAPLGQELAICSVTITVLRHKLPAFSGKPKTKTRIRRSHCLGATSALPRHRLNPAQEYLGRHLPRILMACLGITAVLGRIQAVCLAITIIPTIMVCSVAITPPRNHSSVGATQQVESLATRQANSEEEVVVVSLAITTNSRLSSSPDHPRLGTIIIPALVSLVI